MEREYDICSAYYYCMHPANTRNKNVNTNNSNWRRYIVMSSALIWLSFGICKRELLGLQLCVHAFLCSISLPRILSLCLSVSFSSCLCPSLIIVHTLMKCLKLIKRNSMQRMFGWVRAPARTHTHTHKRRDTERICRSIETKQNKQEMIELCVWIAMALEWQS